MYYYLVSSIDFPQEGVVLKQKIDQIFARNSLKTKNQITQDSGRVASYAKIANESEISVDVVKRIFNGTRPAKLSEAYAIAAALDKTVGYLTKSSDQENLQRTIARWLEINEQRAKHTGNLFRCFEKMQECDREARELWEIFEKSTL